MAITHKNPALQEFLKLTGTIRYSLNGEGSDASSVRLPSKEWDAFHASLQSQKDAGWPVLPAFKKLDQYLQITLAAARQPDGTYPTYSYISIPLGHLRACERELWADLQGGPKRQAEQLIIRMTNRMPDLANTKYDETHWIAVSAEDCFQLHAALSEVGAEGLRSDPHIGKIYEFLTDPLRCKMPEDPARNSVEFISCQIGIWRQARSALTAQEPSGPPPAESPRLIATNIAVPDRPTYLRSKTAPLETVPYLKVVR